MTAFYNEIDPYAAQWLRNLIAAGHIAPGIVDERSIEDIHPNDLRQYTQCHFFAGIGVWSYALRLAGWPDDRPVWTGSCPCQPFSAAGKGEGLADERHLWPAFHHLISQCRPSIVFGEQVASKGGLEWLDLVQTDLEGSGYASAAADLCAAGIGAPHIRQRLYWVAHADNAERWANTTGRDHSDGPDAGWPQGASDVKRCSRYGWMDNNNNNQGLEGFGDRHQAAIGRVGEIRPVAEAGESGGLADTEHDGRGGSQSDQTKSSGDKSNFQIPDGGHPASQEQPTSGPTNGYWRDADWLFCRDGKWRPVEPGTFPLAHGAAARVGRLRAYGNAIVPQVAQAFIAAHMEGQL